MTPRGQAFVASMEAVKVLLRSGLKPFVAMSAGLEDDDWLLVYAAAAKMAEDIRASVPQAHRGTL